MEFITYGEWNYDHLILFAPSADDILGVDPDIVLEFIDSGRNVLIAGDSDLGSFSREVASECNVEFDEEGTFVIDHFNYESNDEGDHSLLVVSSSPFNDIPVVFDSKKDDSLPPIIFQGIAQDIEEESPLLIRGLSASSTAYSKDPELEDEDEDYEADSFVFGRKISLVTLFQARNNARVGFTGSISLFSDEFFESPVEYSPSGKKATFPKSGNEVFCKKITEWVFQERGILRARDVRHHRINESEAPEVYTIKEELEYSVIVEEWYKDHWRPYSGDDIQIEFTMLDPYIRKTLSPSPNINECVFSTRSSTRSGRFCTRFRIPDVYGVYTFRINYVKEGYSFLQVEDQVSVRPLKHDQYERFIPAAFPYYASAFSMMAGLFVFSCLYLHHR